MQDMQPLAPGAGLMLLRCCKNDSSASLDAVVMKEVVGWPGFTKLRRGWVTKTMASVSLPVSNVSMQGQTCCLLRKVVHMICEYTATT